MVSNEKLHQLAPREAVPCNFHLYQPILNWQPLPQNPNHLPNLLLRHLLLLRLVESVRRRRRPLATRFLQPPLQLLAAVLPQRVQLHQASDQPLAEEDLRHRRAPRSLSQLLLPLRENVDVYLNEPQRSLSEEPSHRTTLSAVRAREEADFHSRKRIRRRVVFVFHRHEDL